MKKVRSVVVEREEEEQNSVPFVSGSQGAVYLPDPEYFPRVPTGSLSYCFT
jgi:hypothetical protein